MATKPKGLIADEMPPAEGVDSAAGSDTMAPPADPNEAAEPPESAAEQGPAEEAKEPDGGGEGGDAHEQLAQIHAEIQKKIPPQMLEAVKRVVLAGEKFMFDPTSHDLAMKNVMPGPGEDPAEKFATGIAALMTILQRSAKGQMPGGAIVPAACLLMVELLDFMGQGGAIQVTPELIGKSFQDLLAFMMQKSGVKLPGDQGGGMGGPDPNAQPGAPPAQPQQAAAAPPGGGGLIQSAMGG